jgi:hypothetical protein
VAILAAEDDGRRPAFTVAARPAKLVSRINGLPAGIIGHAIVFTQQRHISSTAVESSRLMAMAAMASSTSPGVRLDHQSWKRPAGSMHGVRSS